MKEKIKTLIKLLGDEDTETSTKAMAEIIRNERLASRIIARLQESDDPQLRKTAHQMQVAVKLRKRRQKLSYMLSSDNVNLLDALVQIHLQWFDEDSEDYILKEWNRFRSLSKNWDANNINNLAELMTALSMQCTQFEELECADYCIGEIIATAKGADFMLCAIGAILAREEKWNPSIIATDAGFCLYDENQKTGLFPAKNWLFTKVEIKNNVKRWNDIMLINLALSSMFFCSMATGELRYSYIIGSIISKSIKADFNKIMPYPLGEKKILDI